MGLAVSQSVCTSSTRPANPYPGIRIFETNTGRELMHDGVGWVIMSESTQSFSPSWVNVSGGTPYTLTGTSHRSDGWCDFSASLTLGSTPSSLTNLAFILPYTGVNVQRGQFMVNFLDALTLQYPGTNDPGTVTIPIFPLDASSTYLRNAGSVTITAPFTWGTTDAVTIAGRFQMASRYS